MPGGGNARRNAAAAIIAVVAVIAVVVVVVAVLRVRAKVAAPRSPLPPRRGIPRPEKPAVATKKLDRAQILARYAAGERDFTGLVVNDELDESRIVLDGADLSSSRANRANISGSYKGAKLRAANLIGCSFLGTDLREVDFRDASLRGDFDHGSNLRGADFRRARLWETHFGDSDLTSANFDGAHIMSADFQRATLAGASFKGALYGEHVTWPKGFSPSEAGARLVGPHADFHGLDFSDRVLTGSDGFSFAGTDLRGASFRMSDLVDVVFRDADLRGADFTGANLIAADFTGAKVEGANFRDAVVARIPGSSEHGTRGEMDFRALGAIVIEEGADLRNVDFTGLVFYDAAPFRRVDLRGSSFVRAHFHVPSFTYANLEDVDFTDAKSRWLAGMECCDLTRTNFTRSWFKTSGDLEHESSHYDGTILHDGSLARQRPFAKTCKTDEIPRH